MPHFKYIVFTQPVAGREDEYNDWYSNEHLHDVLKIEGFVAAQRFKIVESGMNSQPAMRYLSIYEIEAADPEDVLTRLANTALSGGMVMSDALDIPASQTILYAPITERIVA